MGWGVLAAFSFRSQHPRPGAAHLDIGLHILRTFWSLELQWLVSASLNRQFVRHLYFWIQKADWNGRHKRSDIPNKIGIKFCNDAEIKRAFSPELWRNIGQKLIKYSHSWRFSPPPLPATPRIAFSSSGNFFCASVSSTCIFQSSYCQRNDVEGPLGSRLTVLIVKKNLRKLERISSVDSKKIRKVVATLPSLAFTATSFAAWVHCMGCQKPWEKTKAAHRQERLQEREDAFLCWKAWILCSFRPFLGWVWLVVNMHVSVKKCLFLNNDFVPQSATNNRISNPIFLHSSVLVAIDLSTLWPLSHMATPLRVCQTLFCRAR